ncbi:RNA-binding S4 domain-containing protein [Paracoccus sp. p4-l81]|uniref:RNA-binding S4 domain-containing protein n=1 Tax=unclassified Paracoccus (in: a-proteobacteria) TaxID=2688777 RepID=UPI0035B6AD2C
MSDDTIRLDKWLWQARFAKTRSLAQALIEGGKARVNGAPCLKPGRAIRPGDVLTLRLDGGVQVLTVIASGSRRGPATEAATLYRIHDDPLGGVE